MIRVYENIFVGCHADNKSFAGANSDGIILTPPAFQYYRALLRTIASH